jgi:serine/threonine-protein kinase SRPK3
MCCKSPKLSLARLLKQKQIYELIQGRVLFRGRPGLKDAWTAEEDQIAQMIELFGPIPASIRQSGKLSTRYMDENGEYRKYKPYPTTLTLLVGKLLHIKQLYPCSLRDLLAQTTNTSMSVNSYEKFEAFLRAMLQYEPSKRKPPKELLKEPWLSD